MQFDDLETDGYEVQTRREAPQRSSQNHQKNRRFTSPRKSKRSTGFGGMHRRRMKK